MCGTQAQPGPGTGSATVLRHSGTSAALRLSLARALAVPRFYPAGTRGLVRGEQAGLGPRPRSRLTETQARPSHRDTGSWRA